MSRLRCSLLVKALCPLATFTSLTFTCVFKTMHNFEYVYLVSLRGQKHFMTHQVNHAVVKQPKSLQLSPWLTRLRYVLCILVKRNWQLLLNKSTQCRQYSCSFLENSKQCTSKPLRYNYTQCEKIHQCVYILCVISFQSDTPNYTILMVLLDILVCYILPTLIFVIPISLFAYVLLLFSGQFYSPQNDVLSSRPS